MSEIIIHETIADLHHTLNLPVTQDLDFTMHYLPDLYSELPFKSPTFRGGYFSFVFVKSGKGYYINDNHQFSFQPNTLYFTNPGHLKVCQIDEMEDAYIITLTEGFLRENVHADIFEEFPFILAEIVPPKTLSAQEFQEFEAIYKQMFYHFRQDSAYKKRILGSLFMVLLLKIKEQCWQCYNPIDEGDRNSQIVKSFKLLLAKQFKDILHSPKERALLQVQDLAQELSLHPNYLTAVIKSKTGKSVNQWISKRTTSTAKSMLKSTNFSAKEISYSLGFSEPTHFSRFFKKQTGMTPSIYKKSLQTINS